VRALRRADLLVADGRPAVARRSLALTGAAIGGCVTGLLMLLGLAAGLTAALTAGR
jgi:hypothetical protein